MAIFQTIQRAAEENGCTYNTVRTKIADGDLPAYKLPGKRGHYVDQAEAKAVLGRRKPYGTFGPDAIVRDLSKVVDGDFVVVE